MKSDNDSVAARFGSTIEIYRSVLRHQGAPDMAGLVCWTEDKPERWWPGNDPEPGEHCEPLHVYVSQFGDDSDKWKAIRRAAWAVSLWEAITNPEPETRLDNLLIWAISLGVIIREVEELGLVDEVSVVR